MEQDFHSMAQPQRRLNPTMKEVVKKEVQKLMKVEMIYPISKVLGSTLFKLFLRREA